MLYLALHYFVTSVICMVAGIVFYELMPALQRVDRPASKPAFVYFLTGLIVLTGIGQWVILAFPLQWPAQLLLLLLLAGLSLVVRKGLAARLQDLCNRFRQSSPLLKCCFPALLLVVLLLNAGPSLMDDTDSYHLQMVKWIQEYGTVKGLANLHLRYGFNSSWFTSIALFSYPFPGIHSGMALNGLVSAWLCQYLLARLTVRAANGNRPPAGNLFAGLLVVFALALFTWPMIRGNASSANYDFITCCCILVLFTGQLTAGNPFQWLAEWLLWGGYLFTVRFINFPLLLLPLAACLLLIRSGRGRSAFSYTLAGILLIVPFLVRNVQLSGYILFPVHQVDLFQVDWKADRQMTMNIADYIRYFNRVNVLFQPLEETSALGFPYWVPHWFRHIFAYDKPVVVLGIAGIAISLVCLGNIRRRFSTAMCWLLLTAGLQLLCWFFFFPDPRFAYGPLLLFLLTGILLLPVPLFPERIARLLVLALSMAVLAYGGNKLLKGYATRQLAYPAPLPVPALDTVRIDGLTLFIPGKLPGNWNSRCYGSPLPCVYRVDPRLRARGHSVADGFYLEKQVATNKQKGNLYDWY